MTTIYMKTTTPDIAHHPATLHRQGSKIIGDHDDDVIHAIAPFGGSAHPVPHPDKQILGGKGFGLQEMSSLGIDVPPGFTLATPLCQVYQDKGDLPDEMWKEVEHAIKRVEEDMGRKFGDSENPLLFSCRSGAAVSMPGMMDTVLNIVSQRPMISRRYESYDV